MKERGLRAAVKEVAQRATAVSRLQAELVKAELASTGKNAGIGAALAFAAAFIGVFVFGLVTALLVVVLAIPLPLWLSILIVLVLYLIVMAALGALARDRFNKTKGPRLSKEQARLTAAALGIRPKDGSTPSPTPGPAPPIDVSAGVTANASPADQSSGFNAG